MLILLIGQSWATCTQQQFVKTTTCSSASTTCAATVAATGSGNAIAVGAGFAAAAITLSGISGGGTYSHCSACVSSDATVARSSDIYYTLASTSGTTSITATRSASGSNWNIGVWEVSCAGAMTVDTGTPNGGNVDNTTGSTSQPGVGFTISGTNDFMFQVGISSANVTSVSGGTYAGLGALTNGFGFSGQLNSTFSTAPTWGLAASARLVGSGLAIMEGAAQSGHNPTLPILGVGR